MIKRELINKNVDGIDFKIMEFTWKESLALEKRTLEIVSPALDLVSSLKNCMKQGASFLDLDIKGLGNIFQSMLLSMDDPFEYIKSMVKNTYYPKRNKNGVLDTQLDNDEIINEVFHGKTLVAVKLCVEVMQVNKFAFIEGLGGLGNLTGIYNNIKNELTSKEKTLDDSDS